MPEGVTVTSTWDMIFFIVALILFIAAAVGLVANRINLMAAGLAFFALPFVIAAVQAHN
jgi:hypothetical protein